MSFLIINHTKINIRYIESRAERFIDYCDHLPGLTVIFEPWRENITHSKPICAVGGCCFYDSNAEGGFIVISKESIYVKMNSLCDTVSVYFSENLPSHRFNDVMELITYAYAYAVTRNGGICLKTLPIAKGGAYECLCAQYDTLADKLYSSYLMDEIKTGTAKMYCVFKQGDEHILCAMPWNTKKNESLITPAHIKRIVCLKRGDTPKLIRLNVQQAVTLLRSNSFLCNSDDEKNSLFLDNISSVAENLDVYTAVCDV